jgi:hypothetical protein
VVQTEEECKNGLARSLERAAALLRRLRVAGFGHRLRLSNVTGLTAAGRQAVVDPLPRRTGAQGGDQRGDLRRPCGGSPISWLPGRAVDGCKACGPGRRRAAVWPAPRVWFVRSFGCSWRVTVTFGATTRFDKRTLPVRVTTFLAQIGAVSVRMGRLDGRRERGQSGRLRARPLIWVALDMDHEHVA